MQFCKYIATYFCSFCHFETVLAHGFKCVKQTIKKSFIICIFITNYGASSCAISYSQGWQSPHTSHRVRP